ncbi:unnamed protein product, partial [Urochloa humidicola]
MASSSRNQRLAAVVGDDEREVQVSLDQELADLGQAGEDDDDLMGGREALFGRVADDPIDVDVDGDAAGASEEQQETETQSTGAKRTRPCTSDAWDDFEPIYKVIKVGERPRKFGLDMDVRWNSTYLMLKHVVGHKKSFSVFIQTQYPRAPDAPPLLTDAHWYVAEHILTFLELFYDSTVALSGVYYPTSPLILHHLLEIAGHLNSYENDKLLRSVVVPMKSKFLKYWADIPMLYSVAFIMDPRAKMRGLTNALVLLSNLTGTDYSPYLTEVRAELYDMFNKYDAKFGAVRMQRPVQPVGAGRKKTAWGKIYGSGPSDSSSFGSGSSTSVSTPPSLTRRTSASTLLQAATTGAAALGSELSSYLDSDTVNQFDDDFNIINWWHEHKLSYPVLSIFAKDVLSVPVS